MGNSEAVVLARKFNGKPHYEYGVRILAPSRPVLCLSGPGTQITHHTGGFQFNGGAGYGIYHFSETDYFTVSWGFDPQGRLRHVCCDVATPATYVDGRIEYVDLDLDIVASVGKGTELQDQDEFEAHRVEFRYPPRLVTRANEAARLLMERADAGAFPFGVSRPGDILRHVLDDEVVGRIVEENPDVPW